MRNSYTPAIIFSVVLHAILIVVLVFGGAFTPEEITKPKAQQPGEAIKAVAIDPVVVKQQALKIKREKEAAKRAEQKRKEKLAKEAKARALKKKQEEERIAKLKKERILAEKRAKEAKAKEAERLKEQKIAQEKARIAKQVAAKLEAERVAKLAEKKKAEEEAQKAEEARLAKLEEKRKAEEAAEKAKQAEEEARKKAEEARKEQEEQEAILNDMFADLDAESAQRQSAKSQMVSDEVNRNAAVFQNLIQQKLRLNNSMLGKQCQLSLNLANNGLVISVENAQGNTALCNAAKAAVLEVQQFPMPEDPDVVKEMKKIRLVVEPQ